MVLLKLMWREIDLVPSEAVMNLDEIQSHSYGGTELHQTQYQSSELARWSYNSEQHCQIVPTQAFHNECSSGEPQNCCSGR